MNPISRNNFGRKSFGLALVLILALLASTPTPKAAVASESQEHVKTALAELPMPLPRGCGGINPPGAPVPACCIFGYIYYIDVPVAGARVQIDSFHGTRVITTSLGGDSDDPYYVADLSAGPLEVSLDDVITITASYNGMTSIRTWTVQSDGQHVDLGLVTGYQATGPLSDLDTHHPDSNRQDAVARHILTPNDISATHIVTSTADNGEGTLRRAMQNASTGDTITFDTGIFPPTSPVTISLTTGPLPDIITDSLTIDASNAGVILDGGNLSSGNGFRVSSDDNTINGLQILNFPNDGILLYDGASGNHIGGVNATPGGACTGDCNVVSGNGGRGIGIYGPDTSGNVVSGNHIGIDASGTTAMGNSAVGIQIFTQAHGNQIGGSVPGERNVISGNNASGIQLNDSGTISNTVTGNYIGTDASGTVAIKNHGQGIQIGSGAQQNQIGGSTAGERNVISGNGWNGVMVCGANAMSNTVTGNYIGTDYSGSFAVGNGGEGVLICSDARGNRVGGSVPGERNVISGNGWNGVKICDPNTMNNTVTGNYIGANAGGTSAVGNGGEGVLICSGAQENQIGGTGDGEGNLISGNLWSGVKLNDSDTTGNTISGNYIGTNISATASISNTGHGILIEGGASRNTVGISNTIAFNGSHGIEVRGSDTLTNTITRNSIFLNQGEGITLTNGGNRELPAPQLVDVGWGSGVVSGTACANCTIEVFSDDENEGKTFEGDTVTDGGGSFTLDKQSAFTGPCLTAAATDAQGNTSAFSVPACIDEEPITGLTAINDGPTLLGTATTLTATVETGTNVIYTWDLGDGGTGSGALVTHVYPVTGTHTAIVTATNAASVVTATTTITVTQGEPLSDVSITGPATGIVNTICTFTATVSPPTAAIPITYVWQATGQTPVMHANSFSHTDVVTLTWATTGTQFITVTAGHALGVVTTTKAVVVTDYMPPAAAFAATPLTGTASLDVQFTDQSTGDIVSWDWTLGDGSVSGARHPDYTYENAGIYTVSFAVAGPGGSDTQVKTDYINVTDRWTFILYFAGDNNLHHALKRAVDEMERVANKPYVNIVVLRDGAQNGDTYRYDVEYDTSPGITTPAIHLGELNTGITPTLVSFVNWARSEYPADHYLLSIANHGRGTTGIAWDDTSSGDKLDAYHEENGAGNGLRSALDAITSSGSDKIDVLFLDACLMGLVEDAYEVEGYVDYLVASENLGWSVFAYDEYVSSVTKSTTPREMATNVADTYFAALHGYPGTVSALDMAEIENVGGDTDALAQALRAYLDGHPLNVSEIISSRNAVQTFDSRNYLVLDSSDEYIDLYHFAELVASNVSSPTVQSAAQGVMDAVANCVIAEHHQSGQDPWSGNYWGLDDAHGIAVYFPPASGGWDYTRYTTSSSWSFCNVTAWDEFLTKYFEKVPLVEPPIDPGVPPTQMIERLFLPLVLKGN